VVLVSDERLLTGRRTSSLHEGARGGRAVSSKFMTAAHACRYDLADLSAFFAKQCVGAGAVFDFGKAEARLLERFRRMPVIDLELKAFSFAHEAQLSGGLASLRARVPQEPLPADAADAIRREVASPARAARILDQLEMAIAFLAATGGSFHGHLAAAVGDLPLAAYIKGFLLVDDAQAVDLGRAVAALVRLKHLEALFALLTGLTNVDPFAAVSRAYTAKLEPDAKAALEEFVAGLGERERGQLQDLLRGYLTSHLTESTTSAAAALGTVLGFLEIDDAYVASLEWFRPFPAAVAVASALDAYRTVESLV
jgi:hypothetical protein